MQNAEVKNHFEQFRNSKRESRPTGLARAVKVPSVWMRRSFPQPTIRANRRSRQPLSGNRQSWKQIRLLSVPAWLHGSLPLPKFPLVKAVFPKPGQRSPSAGPSKAGECAVRKSSFVQPNRVSLILSFPFCVLHSAFCLQKYSGSFPGFHLILHPMLAFWLDETGLSASTASMAARRSFPVTGTLLPGRLSSNWPR